MATTPDVEHSVTVERKSTLYWRLLQNPSLLLLWSGETVSVFGDEFFLLAATWVVYIQSNSILQTALIQVVWHLDRLIFSPLAGVLADRWNRKWMMVVTNLFSALVVGALAAWFALKGPFTPVAIFATVFLLNSLATFYAPASLAVLPEMVGKDALTTTSGLFSTAFQLVSIAGSALAGVVIASFGTMWALIIDAITFVYAMVAIRLAQIPQAPIEPRKQNSLHRDFLDGWNVLAGLPVVWALTWLGVFLNVAAFMGPLYPALVRQQLHGDAAVLGLVATLSGIGALCAGVCAGPLERAFGGGRLTAAAWSLAGISILGMAFSTIIPLTAFLEAVRAFGITIGSISSSALMQGQLPQEYRGRGVGIIRWVSVVAIPLSALLGGWLADRLGVGTLFAVGGAWILGISAVAWFNRHLRKARL